MPFVCPEVLRQAQGPGDAAGVPAEGWLQPMSPPERLLGAWLLTWEMEATRLAFITGEAMWSCFM